jgi:hypothetical protein
VARRLHVGVIGFDIGSVRSLQLHDGEQKTSAP